MECMGTAQKLEIRQDSFMMHLVFLSFHPTRYPKGILSCHGYLILMPTFDATFCLIPYR